MAEIIKRNGSVSIVSDLIFDRYGISIGFAFPYWRRGGKAALFSCTKTRYECGYTYSLIAIPLSICFCVLEG